MSTSTHTLAILGMDYAILQCCSRKVYNLGVSKVIEMLDLSFQLLCIQIKQQLKSHFLHEIVLL